ncbi:hypothetical protein DNTS_022700 [Danionella cerebrum]|uniref:BTB domain-containing protein n=1 Tax=Danionella cerebrum TaxID=2873325 RepID=A0A553MY10_9TELE|nr:hypothetical protein DNTS_022700 [Danionella translucida]
MECVCVDESLGQQVLRVLRSFREKSVMFDFSIHVENETLQCHRCVLAAVSDFFRVMLELDVRESTDGSVTLRNLSADAVHLFLDFAYSGEINIKEDNVEMLFQLSSYLQVDFILRSCSDFLIKTLQLTNCLHLLTMAEDYGSSHLQKHATDFILQNFHAFSSEPDFIDIPDQILERCLASDALNVPDEETVLSAVLRWAQFDPETRKQHLPKLLKLIRLHHSPLSALESASHNQLLTDDQQCVSIINNAIESVQEYSGFFCDARPSTVSSYIFVYKTSDNGDCHAFCYDIALDRWMELTEDAASILDSPGSAFASFGEKVFITGGCRGECHRHIRNHIAEDFHDATNAVFCYCPIERSLTPMVQMQHARSMHTCVTALNRIYVIGGKTCGTSNIRGLLEVEFFDPLIREWTSVSPLPKDIYFPESSVCGNFIYTLGSALEVSETFNPALDCFFRYDLVTDQWCQLVAEFGPFFHAMLVKPVSINDVLYICDLSLYKVFSFCPDTSEWKGEGSFECAGFNAAAIGVRDKIFILGGDFSPDEITDDVQVYDSAQSEWKEVSPMPQALTEFHCEVLNFNSLRNPWRINIVETT